MATSQLDVVTQLAALLGGGKTTSNAGDTSGLQSVLAQLQGGSGNYEQLLQSIFQKAAGQIPGIQAATANAVGARSGRNSAAAAALAQLLKDTTLAGTQAVINAQQTNTSQQLQAATSIANATKGTTQQSGTNLNAAAQNLAIMKLLSESGILKKGGLSNLFGSTDGADAQSTPTSGFVNPVEGFTARQPDYGSAAPAATGVTSGFDAGGFGDTNYILPDTPSTDFNLDDYGGGPTLPVDEIPADYEQQWFADGGLVGRQGQALPTNKGESQEDETQEDLAERKHQARFDLGFTVNKTLDLVNKFIQQSKSRDSENFADGGLVTQRAAGGRRSSAPQIQTTAPTQTAANNTMSAPPPALTPAAPITTISPAASAALGNNTTNYGNSPGINSGVSNQMSSGVRSGIDTATRLNSILGISGLGGIPGLGTVGNLTRAKTPADALKAVGIGALGIAAPQATSLVNVAMNPTAANAIDAGVSLNPAGAIGNALLGLGDSSLGTIATNIYDRVFPNQMMTPEQQAIVAAARDSGAGGGFHGFGSASAQGGLNGGDAGGVGGDSGDSGGGTANAADGGMIPGKGTGIEDDKQINVSGGEYVNSADVVDAVGSEFFDLLQRVFHTPAAIQRAQAKT